MVFCAVAIPCYLLRPIPPKGAVLNPPPSYLLRDLWKYSIANMP